MSKKVDFVIANIIKNYLCRKFEIRSSFKIFHYKSNYFEVVLGLKYDSEIKATLFTTARITLLFHLINWF